MDKALWDAFQECDPQDIKKMQFIRMQLDAFRYFMVTLDSFIQTGKLKEDWLVEEQKPTEERKTYHHVG